MSICRIAIIIFICWLLPFQSAKAQEVDFSEVSGLFVQLEYGAYLPGADLAERFGYNFIAGVNTSYMTRKSHWLFGLQGGFVFGQDVKENVLSSLTSSQNELVGNNNSLALVLLRQRGLNLHFNFGKLLTLSNEDHLKGIRLEAGLGYLYHKIRLQDETSNFQQINDDYAKGYDRLSAGISTRQFVGYQYLSSKRTINFLIGLEFIQGFTQNQRSYNFDTKMADDAKRTDLYYGLKVAWILPFYFGENLSEIYY